MLTFVAPIKEEEYILQWSYRGVPTRPYNNWEGHIGQISQGQWFSCFMVNKKTGERYKLIHFAKQYLFKREKKN